MERLKDTISQIQTLGGVVEFDLPKIGSEVEAKEDGTNADGAE